MSENQMASHYQMSRVSVRSALELLLKENLIEKEIGRGTRVNPGFTVPQNERRTIRIMSTFPSFYAQIALPIVIEEFSYRYPNVEVCSLSVPYRYFCSTINQKELSDLKPDLYLIADDQMNTLQDTAQFFPLAAALRQKVNEFDGWYEKLKEHFLSSDGYSFALPVTFSCVYLACNYHMFEQKNIKLPQSWNIDEFKTVLQNLTLDLNQDGITDHYGMSMVAYTTRWIAAAMRLGVDFTRLKSCRKELKQALAFFQNLLFRERSTVLFDSSESMTNPFFQEYSAVTITTGIEQAGWQYHNRNIDIQPLPFPAERAGKTMAVSNCVLLSQNSENKDLSLAFSELMVSHQVQERLAKERKFPSIYPDINEKIWNTETIKKMNFNESPENIVFMNEMIHNNDLLEECEEEMRLFWLGMETVEETACKIIKLLSKS